MPRCIPCLFVLPLVGSCQVLDEESQPGADLDLVFSTQHHFRGIPNNEEEVLQPAVTGFVDTTRNGTIEVGVEGNVDLSDNNGDAWFPDDQAWDFSLLTFHGSYTETVEGFDLTGGLVSYVPSERDEFPFADERGETRELFLLIGRPFGDYYSTVSIHRDIDEARGWYLNGAIVREFPVDEAWTFGLQGSMGYSDDDQAEWDYGIEERGVSDLRGTATFTYQVTESFSIRGSANASTIVDDDIADWFDLIGIDKKNYWATLGVRWGI